MFSIKPHWAILLAGLAFGSAATTGAAAQELCVKCTGPDMTYRCNVEPGTVGAGGSSIQLYCIRELARMGGHASCSVKRQSQLACDGEPRTLVYGASTAPGTVSDTAPDDAGAGAAPPEPANGSIAGTQSQTADPLTSTQQQPQPAQSSPIPAQPAALPPQHDTDTPKTVEDLAKHAARSSKEQLDKAGRVVVGGVKSAGKTVNKAAKSTWRCLSSFFTDC